MSHAETQVEAIRVLLVEDDSQIRTSVKMALEMNNFVVCEVATGEDALATFAENQPKVVLIDIMLPGIDGFEVCRQIRATSDVFIIMVTARTDTGDVIAGLESGADDYVSKPFDTQELCARIRALIRRGSGEYSKGAKYVSGDLEIRPQEGRVFRNGQQVYLTRTEFHLLCELAGSPDKVFSRELLLDRVWGYGYFGDGRLVDVHVRRLRTKIEADPARPKHVVTVRGLGYRLDPQ